MHDSLIPHCSYCEHFISSFYTDMVTEWGYCTKMLGDNAPTRAETDAIKAEVKSGNWDRLNELQVYCGEFIDIYPE